MQTAIPFFPRFSMMAAIAVLIAVASPMWCQETSAIAVGNAKLVGSPDDWTHHHVVFPDPGSADDAIKNGTYDKWFSIVNDPRYVMQQLKRSAPARGSAADDAARFEEAVRARKEPGEWGLERRKFDQPEISKDWSMVLGTGAAGVGAGNYPAKFSFNATSSSPLNCASAANPDYVVYNTGATGSATQASVVAYDNLYGGTGPVCTGQVPSVYWAFNTSGTVVTSVVLSLNGSQLAYVQTPSSGNAQLVVLTWSKTPTGRTVTATVHNTTAFTVTSGTLTSMDVGATVSGTDIPTGDTIATVTSATAGTFTTAATGAAGGTSVSLAISADAGGPYTLSNNALYPSCAAPCAAIKTFSGTSRSDTISSPYYDYSSDTLFVGDASGGLHRFHPVFNGPPTEVGSPWSSPSTTALSSPVYDNADDLVFVGDASGYLYSVISTGTATKSVEVAVSPGVVDGPLVDISNGYLYAFVSKDMNGTNSKSPCSASLGDQVCNGVIQLPTGFTSSTEFTESVQGVGSTNTLYDGSFDNQYWTSSGASSGTGNLYAIGATGTNEPKLSGTPIADNAFGAAGNGNCQGGFGPPTNASAVVCSVNVLNPITSAAAEGSPLTEIYTGSIDYLFAGVTADGNTTGCASATGCVYSWNATSTLGAAKAATAGSAELGGTSGMIIDNVSTTNGASQIYFSILGTTGSCTTSGTVTDGSCAVQASQSTP